MPGRRTDPLTKRAALAVAVPTALVALAGTLAFAGPAFAANEAASSTTTKPFPTSICGTSSSTGAGSSGSSASSTPSTSPQASASASPSPSNSAATPSASAPTAKPGNNAAASASASPSPSPSASSSSASSSGGFWGWLNGVWQWIFGSAQLPPAAAAPAVNAAYPQSASKSTVSNAAGTGSTVKKTVQSAVQQGTAKLGAVKQAASGTSASASPATTCVPQSAVKKNAASSDGNVAAEIPWHLSTPSMTMYNLTYNGITTIKTINGSLQVLDFTASKVTLLTMVTYSQQGGGKLQYVDGGDNQTVTLTNVHLWTTSMTANLLGLINVTLTPTSTPTALLGLLQGVTVPLPILFTNVEADNAFLNTQLIDIPGFNGHGN